MSSGVNEGRGKGSQRKHFLTKFDGKRKVRARKVACESKVGGLFLPFSRWRI